MLIFAKKKAMIEELLRPLISERFANDPKYREGHIRIVAPAPGTEILGLHTPEMKSVAKKLAQGDWRGTAAAFEREVREHRRLFHEEFIVWGLMINYVKCPLPERLRMTEAFLPVIDNWAVCDTFCCSAKWAGGKDREAVWEWMQGLYASGAEFTVRVAIVLSMIHFTDADTLDRTFSRIASMHLQDDAPYYIRMAVAWLMATALVSFPEKTREFARSGALPESTLRLYVRKARESRRTRDVAAL